MKICFITTTIFNLGGVQRVVSVLASELSKNNKVEVICTDERFHINREMYGLSSSVSINFNKELIQKNFINKIFCRTFQKVNLLTGIFNNVNMDGLLTQAYYPKEIQKKFINYLNLQKYDIVIGIEGYYSLLLGIINDSLNAKTIGWLHNSYDAYLKNKDKYYWKQDKLFEKYIPELNRCVVLTNSDKVKYKKRLKIDCEVIYNPLSFECHMKSSCSEKYIIFVGRLLEIQKGLDLLIEAFSIIHKVHTDWKLKIVGDGDDKESLINNIKKHNLENNVLLTGKCDNVKEHYLYSSIFVSTSRWEGFGLSITESMECGVPVVAFDNSGPKEIIDRNNINGVLVENHDAAKFAEEVIKLIEDDEKREAMSLESIKRAQDFKSEKIIKQWNELMEEL
ncbi:glycosyl transferase group 1 [Clostridium sp. DL-VIII]|uniref:glycosyltransferase family 4 protein n=1 Tax=Clostridium sp. DL-VIII TaxID=641107 RepID=UPI00023AFE99|nr:glycosyltransferase family 4 protein [Clostridium sp. DL-VIII]EHI99679.1 glycosyl transferase group 1 [Clostridium sp. DL-VIII]